MWTAYINEAGYGQLTVWNKGSNKTFKAHRLAYEFEVGEIPAGLDLDHLCRNRKCVNPAHLEPVTRRTNLLRGISWNGSKTSCINGHPFDAENTYVQEHKRTCRTCTRLCQARFKLSRELSDA